MKLKSKSLQWVGVVSTAFLNVTVLWPNAFHIPIQIRPWLFIINIFWFIAICSGILHS